MEAVNIAPVDSIGYGRTYTSAAERWAEQRRLVFLVLSAYKAVCSLSIVVAFNCDQESRSRLNRWSPNSCHFKVDVENTVRRVIEGKPESERPVLWTAWSNLLTDDCHIGTVEQRLIRLLAGQMFRKQLHPGLYFRPNPNRYGSRRPL